MKTSRGSRAGLAAIVAFSAALTGCAAVPGGGAAAPAPAVSSAPAPDPKAVLAAAFAAMDQGRYTYDMDLDEVLDGTVLVDNDTDVMYATVAITGDVEAGESLAFEYHVTPEFLFMKMDMSALFAELGAGVPIPEGLDGKKWMRVDPARAGGNLTESMDQVALDPALVERSILTIDQKTPHTFAGTIDLTRLTPQRFGSVGQTAEDKKFTDAAKNVPFQASTDVEGRIVHFAADITAPGGEKASMVMRFYDWDTTELPPVPAAGSWVEPPSGFYEMDVTT